MLRESLRMSLANIRGNKMRSFLTVLGIIIGVMAIIALITVMQSATGEVTAQFESLGTGKLTVQAMGTPLKSGLTESDLDSILSIDGVSGISPTLSQELSVVAGGEVLEDVLVEGYGYAWFRRETDAVSRGRPLLPADQEQRSRVCLIDSDLAAALFSGTDPIGQTVLVKGTRFRIVGVLKDPDVSDVMSQMQAGDESGTLIMPYTAYMRLFGIKGVSSLEVYVDDTDRTDEVTDSLEAALKAAFNYRDDSYTVINMESLLDVMDTMMGLMTNLLVGIASIALLVGGIGIMNIMLVSVTERTREIGIRKALGAKERVILSQFVVEAATTSALGGVLGIVLGYIVSMAANRILPMISSDIDVTVSPSFNSVVVAFGISVGIGVLFGYLPAKRAARLNPIEALRYD